MKKNNFTEQQVAKITETLSPKLSTRINKAGNITVTVANVYGFDWENRKQDNGFWTLYKLNNDTYLWRRHNGHGYCYPLNMVGRNRIGEIHKENYGDETVTWYYRNYDPDKFYFDTFDAALDYFVKYLKKYRKINL